MIMCWEGIKGVNRAGELLCCSKNRLLKIALTNLTASPHSQTTHHTLSYFALCVRRESHLSNQFTGSCVVSGSDYEKLFGVTYKPSLVDAELYPEEKEGAGGEREVKGGSNFDKIKLKVIATVLKVSE